MSERLDSGMTVTEAIARASAWWDATGRKLVSHVGKTDPLLASCSGIIEGAAWDHLTATEKLSIVKVWHHFKVRRPDLLDIEPDAKFRLGGDEVVQ